MPITAKLSNELRSAEQALACLQSVLISQRRAIKGKRQANMILEGPRVEIRRLRRQIAKLKREAADDV